MWIYSTYQIQQNFPIWASLRDIVNIRDYVMKISFLKKSYYKIALVKFIVSKPLEDLICLNN